MVVLAALAGGTGFILASRIPAAYRPARLTPVQQSAHVNTFTSLAGEFISQIGTGQPETWTITARQANLCLGSVDKIASFYSARTVHPMAELERTGLTGPAVAMREGVLTLMIRSERHKKILSLDVTFTLDEQGEMRLAFQAMRVGLMPVPEFLLRGKIRETRAELQDLLGGRGRPDQIDPEDGVANFLNAAVGMLDGRAVRPGIRHGPHRVRISRVEITDGALTLHLQPVPRRPKASSGPSPDGEE